MRLCRLIRVVSLVILVSSSLALSYGYEESDEEGEGIESTSKILRTAKSELRKLHKKLSTPEEDESWLRSLRQERALKSGDQPLPQQNKKKSKKRENRKKLAIHAVEKIIADKLEEHLEPLNAALRLVRFDALSEGILRQLTSLEHIQSKLLTEFGELRAAVNEVGRHTLDLGRQVAGLDERLADLGRQLPHRMDLTANRGEFRAETSSRPSNPFVDIPHQTEILKDALLTITSKISGTERRFKDDLMVLGNLTTETVRASQAFLERRITEVALDTERLLVTVEKLGNKSTSCSQSLSASPSVSSSHTDRFFRRPSPLNPELASHKLSNSEGSRDDLIYLPAEDRSMNSGGGRREERQHPPSITPFTGWVPPVTEVQTFNLGTVSRLASQIAKHMINQGEYPGARDCLDIATQGERRSGLYTIYPASCSSRFAVRVWCELEESSGGWTVIQRRGPWGVATSEPSAPSGVAPATTAPPVDFFRDWADYKWGFGDVNDEYWLGNEYIYQLTQSGDYDLRIELHDWSSEMRWAEYSHFYIGNEANNYTLHIGEYTGNAGNSLKQHQGAAFSTKDRDNDANPRGHCARTFHGAWWFTSCHESHLNGLYHKGRHKSYGEGINWLAFRGHNYSLKMSRMMVKPAKKRV